MMFTTIANHVNIVADQRACDNLMFGPHTLGSYMPRITDLMSWTRIRFCTHTNTNEF
jgi:hypothetical protein